MKIKIYIMCAVLLLSQTTSYCQKTQVSVQKGKVKAQTESSTVTVDAGQKAVLMQDKEPLITVDDPLVDQIMSIYKLVEVEKQAKREKIDSSFIFVSKIENEHLCTVAFFTEQQNLDSEPGNIYHLPESTIHKDPKFYDMQGNLLKYGLEITNSKRGRYTLFFPGYVESGDKFRFICVSKVELDQEIKKEGSLRIIRQWWSAPNQLNYYRYILPESSVFVDSSRPVTIVDSQKERTALTFRNYTGPIADGYLKIAFLWPDLDQTTLLDIPPQYRGLRDQSEEEAVKEGHNVIAEIIAGKTYEDQSTPLKTLQSFCSALIHKNRQQFVDLMDESIRDFVAAQYDMFVGEYSSLLSEFEYLDTPEWPEKPENGHTHPVYLCRKGSLLRAITIHMIFHNGKWYWLNASFDG